MVTSPTARNRWLTLSMGIMTASFLSFTIFFAYNCSSNNPYISLLVFQRPETSILILTVAVQLTIFSLAEFTSAVLDATRWALACSSSGTSALTFLALSRATNFIGAIYLTCTGNGQGGLRIWGSQRILLTLTRFGLAVILLSDVSFRPVYPIVTQLPVLQAGLTRMDSSLLQQQNSSFYATIPDSFWWYFPSILADGKYSRSVSPVSCSGDSCESYFFPGPLQIVKFAPNVSTVTTSDYPNVRTFIQEDAPGFQVDFYPLNGSNPALTLDDCRMYATPVLSQVTQDSFLELTIAWSSCPLIQQQAQTCLSNTTWRAQAPSNIMMSVYMRRASAVYDRYNYTVIDVLDMTEPVPANYTAEDFFGFFDVIFGIPFNTTGWSLSTQYRLLLHISSFVQENQDNQIVSGEGVRRAKLQSFLATPMAAFNDAWQEQNITEGMGKTIALAGQSYRLVIASPTMYIFLVGGVVSIVWCLVVLVVCWVEGFPITSMFPEVDFASKVAGRTSPEDTQSLPALLSSLSHSDSPEIRDGLGRSRFYMYKMDERAPDKEQTTSQPDYQEVPQGIYKWTSR